HGWRDDDPMAAELRDEVPRRKSVEVRVEPAEPHPLPDGGDVRTPRDPRPPFWREESVIDEGARVLEAVDPVRRGLAGARRPEVAGHGEPVRVRLPDRGPGEGGRDVHVQLQPVDAHAVLAADFRRRLFGIAERAAGGPD